MSVNLCVFVGNMGRDPEVKYSQAGKAYAHFSIAVDQGYGDRKKTIWLNCSVFDKTAEFAGQYLKKGNKVYVQGELTEDTYTDKDSGAERKSMKLVVNKLQSLSSNPANGSAGQSQAAAGTAPTEPINSEDIPF